MKVRVRVREPGTRRTQYKWHWHNWALPLRLVWATSWFPGPTATTELDDRWLRQDYLVIHVLCAILEVVVRGPLFEEPEE